MGLFVSQECAFRPVLLELYLLIHHSLIQHHLVSKMVEERVVSKVRLSKLDTRLSSSNDPVGMEVDTVLSKPSTSSSSKPFQALIEECVLEGKHLKILEKFFDSLLRRRYVSLIQEKGLVPLPTVMCVSMRAIFFVVFIFPSILLFTSYLITLRLPLVNSSQMRGGRS